VTCRAIRAALPRAAGQSAPWSSSASTPDRPQPARQRPPRRSLVSTRGANQISPVGAGRSLAAPAYVIATSRPLPRACAHACADGRALGVASPAGLARGGRCQRFLRMCSERVTFVSHEAGRAAAARAERRLALGPLRPRGEDSVTALVLLRSTARPTRSGRLGASRQPIQYRHVPMPARAVGRMNPLPDHRCLRAAVSGFALDWRSIAAMRARGVRLTRSARGRTLLHRDAESIDATVDSPTASRTRLHGRSGAHSKGGRIIAIGTTSCARSSCRFTGWIRAWRRRRCTQRIDAASRCEWSMRSSRNPRTSTSHYQLLRAFADENRSPRKRRARRSRYPPHESATRS